MVNIEEFFLVILEVAVAIMGFSGIILAIASRGSNTSLDVRIGFNALLVAPVFLAAFSSFAFILYRSSANKDDAIQILSGIIAFYVLAILTTRWLQMGVSVWIAQLSNSPGFALATLFMVINFFLQAANLIQFHSSLLLLAGVLMLVVTVLLIFTSFLWTLWNKT